jgi:hypothetical protein
VCLGILGPRSVDCHNDDVDVGYLKQWFAEAFVESIFRQAGYQVARPGRPGRVHGVSRGGVVEFKPVLSLWRKDRDPYLHPRLAVDVQYRVALPRSDELQELAARAPGPWAARYCVVVTDSFQHDRSCFQVVALTGSSGGSRWLEFVDLHRLPELEPFPTTVAKYEGLVWTIFGLLSQPAVQRDDLVKVLQCRVRASSTLPLSIRVELRKVLENLKSEDNDATSTVAAWQFFRAAAPDIWNEAAPIRDVLMSKAVKKALDLD